MAVNFSLFPWLCRAGFQGLSVFLPTGVSLEQLWGALNRAISIAPRGGLPLMQPPLHTSGGKHHQCAGWDGGVLPRVQHWLCFLNQHDELDLFVN